MRHKIRLDGVVTPADARLEYAYLPFEVPAGARRIEVNYHYDNQVVGAQEFTSIRRAPAGTSNGW